MTSKREVWQLDQFAKSIFFHQKLHEWALLEVAEDIESIAGEDLSWNLDELGISSRAWNRIIHGGIKPLIVFAHPNVLTSVDRSTSYYRMLAMVSQKSMIQVGLSTVRFERASSFPDERSAKLIARRLNTIVSHLIESEIGVKRREFDLWRGMAAGSQAQGSWQNAKGDRAEYAIRSDLLNRLRQTALVPMELEVDATRRVVELDLHDGRRLRMGSEPDVIIYDDYRIYAAVEIKGGIDKAGVLERIGAAMKSLSRVKEEDPTAVTILVMPGASMSKQAINDIQSNKQTVNAMFTFEQVLQEPSRKAEFYGLLGLK